MFNGTVDNVCGQLFRDDGGTGNYSGAELEMTICPDTPGDFVSAYFVAFNIFETAIQGQSCQLAIFDGNSTAATSLGSYTGNDLQGLTVWSTPNNTSGCLTFVFTSPTNPGNFAGWEAEISCGTPCAPPTAAANFVASPADILDINNTPTLQICTGESITVEDNGSFVDGFPIEQWVWDFGDGFVETLTNGNATTHTFNDPGAYTVALMVAYDNGTDLCTSLNIDPLQVFVSTPPIFNTEIQSPICAGSATVDLALDGSPVISELWTDAPDFDAPSISPTGFDAGFTYCSQLEFDFFPADATLEQCTDLISVVAFMEHSYLGDLDINVTCPDGTSVVLQTQGGAGTFLGEPVDVENDLTEGTCYEYGWSETSTLGQIEDPANSSVVNYTNTLGNAVSGNIVNPGIYEPENTLCDLVGCPLNGTWEFCFTDLLGADNGFVCTWNLNINPNLLPGVTVIQPEIVFAEWDFSAYADGSDLIISPSTTVDFGLDVEAVTPGTYPLNFYVENDFGCSADTTVFLEVIDNPGAIITAGPDQIFCSNPVTLLGGLDLGGAPSACGSSAGSFDHCYGPNDNSIFSYCPDNPGDGTMMTISFSAGQMEAGWDFVTVYDGPNATGPVMAMLDANFAGQSFTATNPDGCISFQFTADGGCDCAGFCNFEPIEWCVSCAGSPSTCGYDWLWEPSANLDDPTLVQPTVVDFDGSPTVYTLSVEPVGFDNCAAEATVLVAPGFEFEVDFAQPSCFANDGVIQVDILQDANDPAGPFTIELYDNGNLDTTLVWTNLSDFYLDDKVPGDYTLVVYDNVGCVYNFPILLEDPLPLTLDIPNIQTICLGGTANLTVSSPQDPLNVWTYVWDNGLPNGPVQQVTPNTSTVYTVQGFDVNGCPTDEYQVGVNVLSAINADLVASDFLCSGEEAYLDASASNGGSGVGYTYTWTFEGNILNEDEESIWTIPPSTGEYCVTVADNCETPSATVCTDVVLESPVPIAFSADTTEACGAGTFLFTNETNPALITSSLWAFGDGTYAGESNTVKTFQQPGFYDVSLTVTSLAGGCAYTQVQEAYINVYPIPQVGFFAGPQPTRAPDTDITFDGYSNASVVEWFWTFNTFNPLGYSFEQDPTFQFPPAEGGIYPVQLQITDTHGCVNVVNRQIEIQSMFNLFIPTSFTPNNDGHNDAFFVEGTDIDPDRFEFEIWNRWGELIWSTTNPDDAWYGQVGDEGQYYVPNGPYSYRIEVHSLEEESYRKEVFGVVTIIR
jgi:gliding motility-associated-like protein